LAIFVANGILVCTLLRPLLLHNFRQLGGVELKRPRKEIEGHGFPCPDNH